MASMKMRRKVCSSAFEVEVIGQRFCSIGEELGSSNSPSVAAVSLVRGGWEPSREFSNSCGQNVNNQSWCASTTTTPTTSLPILLIERFWNAATNLGFWYLKNHGVQPDVNVTKQPKPMRSMLTEHSRDDTVEFINITKDDAFAWPSVAHQTYSSTVNSRMESAVPFI
ncbi:hypothetical protein L218DRAFT_950512 [Marasmius fiardii PR-910]|nr:hypothetical protein L218DRAFT_950512 [Marasmius fiardii PR-910]